MYESDPERDYQQQVERGLAGNLAIRLVHGLLGQTFGVYLIEDLLLSAEIPASFTYPPRSRIVTRSAIRSSRRVRVANGLAFLSAIQTRVSQRPGPNL
jgi:hypothetical protein